MVEALVQRRQPGDLVLELRRLGIEPLSHRSLDQNERAKRLDVVGQGFGFRRHARECTRISQLNLRLTTVLIQPVAGHRTAVGGLDLSAWTLDQSSPSSSAASCAEVSRSRPPTA